ALAGHDCTAIDVLAATDYVAAAIEVIDSRIQQRQIGIIEFVADNASSARFALGRKRVRPADVDLTDLDAALYVGFGERDVLVTKGNTGAVLANPVNAIVWLARTLAAVDVDLQPGQVLLSGSCIRAVDVARGDHYRGCVTGLGEVIVEFV
ncbi:2-keto-4-pentenoate hydratase, partial [Mycobacterium sp. 1245852.3]|uniref:2-keto-4-pentenoate hydratase n=1 Tax=Mycobacterium sp. 1245852.3 TaxID=1856860 RepID=UPI000A40F6EC